MATLTLTMVSVSANLTVVRLTAPTAIRLTSGHIFSP
jgi:hypothetical protein